LNLPGGSNDPLLCANPFDDPLQTPCKCFYNGPVNVIIKPMQQYNPFRLLQSAFSSGGDSFFSGVTNAIKGFMLPLWNTVKQVTAFLSSITAMIVEAITTYANPSYVFNLLKNLAVLGAQEAMDQLRSFWDNTVKPGLEGLWAYRHVLIQKMKEGLSWVWENLKSALKALSVTISDIAVTVFGVVKSGVTYAWEKFSYYVGAILDTITPFIPVGPTIKFNVFLWVMIIIIGAFIGVDELLITLYDTLSMTFKNAKDSVEKVFGLFKSILTGT
jgi:phage-related protein